MTNSETAAIIPTENGPFMVTGLDEISTDEGTRAVEDEVALCRCGRSSNKPFCDGSHEAVGFSSERQGNEQDERLTFELDAITVYENVAICSHAGFCAKGRPDEWSDTGHSEDEIVRMCNKCPSGALSYSVGGTELRDQERTPKVTVKRNGPIWVEGGVDLRNTSNWGEGASKEHYTLCRCGASTMMPFCDGSHDEVWPNGESGWGDA